MVAVSTQRLDLRPLDPLAASALLESARERAERIVGAELSDEFLATDVRHILPVQAGLPRPVAAFGVWLILERDPVSTVGSVGFMGPPDDDGLIEIGYSVVPSRQRRGYLVEAASALIGWAFAQPGVRAVRARCAPDNDASIRSLQRLGFARDGWAELSLSWLLLPDGLEPAR